MFDNFRQNFLEKDRFLYKLRVFWLFVILLIFVIFLMLKIVPDGRTVYSRDYSNYIKSGKGFIYNFTPADRVIEQSRELPKIIGDPVYFSVFTPRTFSQAQLTLTYRSKLTSQTPIIEAGILADNIVWRYDLKPLKNNILDNLAADWYKLSNNNLQFFQSSQHYQSVEDFLEALENNNLEDCPNGPTACVATYNYEPNFHFKFKEAENTTSQLGVNSIPLRGAHSLFVYLDNNYFNFNIDFVDLNQDKAADPIRLLLFKNKELIAEIELLDDNLQPVSGLEEQKNLFLEKDGLEPGLYKVEIKIGDDVVIKHWEISTDSFVFINKVWPVSYNKAINFFTDASYLQVKALDPASLQTIIFGGEKFTIPEAYQQIDFKLSAPSKKNNIILEKSDVILESNGVFALSADKIFNPSFIKIDRNFTLTPEIKYIIASYEEPKTEGNLLESKAEFNLMGVYREKGKYNFMISVPGLKADSNNDQYLEIEKIEIEFYGRNLWQKLFNLKEKTYVW